MSGHGERHTRLGIQVSQISRHSCKFIVHSDTDQTRSSACSIHTYHLAHTSSSLPPSHSLSLSLSLSHTVVLDIGKVVRDIPATRTAHVLYSDARILSIRIPLPSSFFIPISRFYPLTARVLFRSFDCYSFFGSLDAVPTFFLYPSSSKKRTRNVVPIKILSLIVLLLQKPC
jgi:hypothetical protein